MAGGFGYTVTAPMEIPQQILYSPFSVGRAETKELPDITDTSTSGLRLQGTLAKALPKMDIIDSGTTVRAEEAALEQYATRRAFDITKVQQARTKAIARINNERKQNYVEGSAKPRTSSAYARSKGAKAREKNATYRAAQRLLRPSTFPYLTHIR